ncbi:hypothetical protein BSKO_07130 [Bryopsis sp. KO-2023]|nr:hypothetical protein BSKO_07130 [Bryopsis sp. KO-2023]
MDVFARLQVGPSCSHLTQAKARVHTCRYADSLRGGRFAPQLRTASSRGAGRSVSSHRRQSPVVAAASAGTVRLIIQGRNLELTEAVRDYAEQKISKAVEHYEQAVKEVDVNMSVRGGDTGTKGDKQQKIEVTVHTLRNGIVRSETVADSMYASIDLVCDKVQRKLRKVKEKAILKGKWPGRGGSRGGPKVGELMEPITEIELNKVVELPPDIIRTKYHALKALTEEEAVEELERMEHDFHLFKDAKSGEVRVLYRRKERGYGVIVPIDESA